MQHAILLRLAIVAAAVLATSAAVPAATWVNPEAACAESVFCSGFEEGSFDLWDDYDGNPAPWNVLLSEPGPLDHTGNHAARFRVPPAGGSTDVLKVLTSNHDRLYARWYQLWEPGYDFQAASHGGGLHGGSRDLLGQSGNRPQGDDWFSAWLEPWNGRLHLYAYYRGMYQDCVDPNGQCWGDHIPCFIDDGSTYCTNPDHAADVLPPLLETGRWYCLEMMIDGGTPVGTPSAADGIFDFWIDGVQYGPWTDLWLRTSPDVRMGLVWLNLYHHGEHSEEGVLMDNLVVATQPIGCLDSTASPIPVPQNLHRTDTK